MKRGSSVFGVFGVMTLMGLLMSGLSAPALAQKGGSGGAGGTGGGGSTARHGGKYSIVWDAAQPINGKTSKATGAVNVSTYVAIINLDVRLSSVNLPDNTPLTVTVYANDYFTGLPWLSKTAGTITLSGQGGSLTAPSLWVTAPGFLPIVTRVVVTQANGAVVVSGHP
jgi:hypothetical protein